MQTRIEKYLKDKRADLDVESPDDFIIWEGIRKDLQAGEARSTRKKMLIRIRNVAAVALIILGVGYAVIDLTEERRTTGDISLATIDRDLGEREKEYQQLLTIKTREAGSLNEIDNLIIAELLEEIQRLDTIYEQTMKDLVELGYNEQVINTIFDTYEKKIYLLELIILENHKSKNYEKEQSMFL